MEYKVKLTKLAVSQLAEATRYIAEILLAPETAEKWLNVLQRQIATLRSMPNRFPLTAEERWKHNGIRKMPVKGFIVYYLVSEEIKTVTVTAVIYGRRDQLATLKETD